MQLFGTPPQLLEHHPIEPQGPGTPTRIPTRSRATGQHRLFRVGILVQLFGTPPHRVAGPPTRPRATPYMVRVLVQPLEHHPTEPQGRRACQSSIQSRSSRPLFDGSTEPAPLSPQQCLVLQLLSLCGLRILDHFVMAGETQAKTSGVDKSIGTPLRARPTEPP